MVPRIAQQGHSFKGAGMYYLHDKEAKTTERVLWTHTHNLPTNDAKKAFKWMAHTAMNANYLKQQSGTVLTGRKTKTGPVYSYSLAWHPDQNPDREIMMQAAYQTLELLGLKEHEAIFVAHNDTEHPHVHVICNLVHPETGKKAAPYNDRLVMSAWAEEQERNEGEILCEQRVINNEIRRNGMSLTNTFDKTQERDYKKVRAIQVQHLYNKTHTTQDFVKGLDSMGYVLARGDRRGYVLVDQQGKAISLTRQLKEQKTSEVNLWFKDLENVRTVKEAVHDQLHFDQDKYETERQQKIVDGAIDAERKKDTPSINKSDKQSVTKKNAQQSRSKDKTTSEFAYGDSHLVRLDNIRDWEQKSNRLRWILEEKQEQQYKRKELLKEMKAIQKELNNPGISGKLFQHKVREKTEYLQALKKNLINIDQRISEQKSALEIKIQKDKPYSHGVNKKDEYIKQLRKRNSSDNNINNDLDMDR